MPYIWPYNRILVWGLCLLIGALLQGTITMKTNRLGLRLCLPVLASIPVLMGFVVPFVAELSGEIQNEGLYVGCSVALPGIFAFGGCTLGHWIGTVVYVLRTVPKKGKE